MYGNLRTFYHEYCATIEAQGMRVIYVDATGVRPDVEVRRDFGECISIVSAEDIARLRDEGLPVEQGPERFIRHLTCMIVDGPAGNITFRPFAAVHEPHAQDPLQPVVQPVVQVAANRAPLEVKLAEDIRRCERYFSVTSYNNKALFDGKDEIEVDSVCEAVLSGENGETFKCPLSQQLAFQPVVLRPDEDNIFELAMVQQLLTRNTRLPTRQGTQIIEIVPAKHAEQYIHRLLKEMIAQPSGGAAAPSDGDVSAVLADGGTLPEGSVGGGAAAAAEAEAEAGESEPGVQGTNPPLSREQIRERRLTFFDRQQAAQMAEIPQQPGHAP
jgi:hypothetical protein